MLLGNFLSFFLLEMFDAEESRDFKPPFLEVVF